MRSWREFYPKRRRSYWGPPPDSLLPRKCVSATHALAMFIRYHKCHKHHARCFVTMEAVVMRTTKCSCTNVCLFHHKRQGFVCHKACDNVAVLAQLVPETDDTHFVAEGRGLGWQQL